MKIACLSDMHLGSDDRSDSFQHKEDSFLYFLDFLEHDYELIILNGDIYDTRKSYALFQTKKKLWDVQNKYTRLVERFEQKNYIQIVGNHDWILKDQGYKTSHSLELDNTSYYFSHGHEFDSFRANGNLQVFGTWAIGWLERLGWTNAEAHLSWMDEKISHWLKKRNVDMLKEGDKEIFNQEKACVIVMGHTHEQPSKIDFGHGVYLNSGGCLRKRIEYIHIDTANKEWIPKRWSKSNCFGIAIETNYPSL